MRTTPTTDPLRRALSAAAAAGLLAVALTSCASPAGSPHQGHNHGHATAGQDTAGHDMAGHGMAGHDTTGTAGAAAGSGLAAERNGYRLAGALAGSEYRFRITGPDGAPVTAYVPEQTEQLHFYAIRSDLTGFQHLHPELGPDGTWRAALEPLAAGDWRLYASFTPDSGPGKGGALVLGEQVTVPGAASPVPLPAAAGSATVDGYTVTVDGGAPKGGELGLTVTRDGQPVTDLQPYLGTFGHLTAFHAGDLAFAHLHPEGAAADGGGGPSLRFHAELPAAGDWRLFVQFRTGGTLHTAALTLRTG
ncbi:hypothetical protein AB0D08_14405 [Kitasatospora sp. NPDC048540]|uniref:hypothetical protein n=1 Tax=unclassified Kitasatospora TaxID=2633591 RepID=UPI0005397788|nr:hypothetical protein [Kitasatospora sp. MBT63]